jgi:hypothetical protein
VWYAGFADKYQQIVGNGNPVSGPYFNLSVPEPTGVVVALATQEPKGHSLLGFTSVVAHKIFCDFFFVGSHEVVNQLCGRLSKHLLGFDRPAPRFVARIWPVNLYGIVCLVDLVSQLGC